MMTDEQFMAQLSKFVGGDSGIEAETPVFRNEDGSVDREKTLGLACYAEFTLHEEN